MLLSLAKQISSIKPKKLEQLELFMIEVYQFHEQFGTKMSFKCSRLIVG